MKNTSEHDQVPQLFTQPITTLSTFFKVVFIDIKNFVQQNLKSVIGLLALLIFYTTIHFIQLSSYQVNLIQTIDQILLFIGFWTGLGILSSIGVASGLHTFILYLGPKVARFVMASQECGNIAQMKPHRWALMPSFECDSNGQELSFWNLFSTICIESMIWGFGTAVGELPPYIITKTARLAGKQCEELESEIKNSKQDNSMLNRTKQKVFEYVKSHSFTTILIMASVPNPLFDLAGLTCGHLLIDFRTFFLATAIGKSLIKVNMQIIAIILILSKESVKFITTKIGKFFGEEIQQKLVSSINNQRKKLLSKNIEDLDGQDWLGAIWNTVLIMVILYYIMSLINSKVKSHYQSKISKKNQLIQKQICIKMILIIQILLSLFS